MNDFMKKIQLKTFVNGRGNGRSVLMCYVPIPSLFDFDDHVQWYVHTQNLRALLSGLKSILLQYEL